VFYRCCQGIEHDQSTSGSAGPVPRY
jgi:hypothetical protein